MRIHLSNIVQTQQVKAPTAMGTSTITSDIVDLQNFNSVRFIVPIDDVADTSVITVKGEKGDAANLSDSGGLYTTDTATKTSAADDDLNGKLLILDLRHVGARYVRVLVTRATANAGIGNIIAEAYDAAKIPVSQNADVSHLKVSEFPAVA